MKTSLTIAIPAYNEQKNIKKLLLSLLNQEIKSAKLHQILVVDDGSTDNTYKEILSVDSNSINCFRDGQNLGKSERLNQIFQMVNTEIIVLIDADVLPSDKYAIENLISGMIASNITLTSGNPEKKENNSIIDKILNVSAFLQEYVKSNLNMGDNVYACHGRLIAIKHRIFKNLSIPPDAVGNDAFIYFSNKTLGGKFAYINSARVTYKMPQTREDFAKQRSRFERSKIMHSKYFKGTLDIHSEYKIPKQIKLKAFLKTLRIMPIQTIGYIFTLVLSMFHKSTTTTKGWAISESTK